MVNKMEQFSQEIAVLQKRLQLLEQKKWVGGANIRITEIDGVHTLIEQTESSRRAVNLPERVAELEDKVADLQQTPELTAGDGLILRNNGSHRILELEPDAISHQMPETTHHSGDDFPFRVRLDDSQPSTGAAKNFVLCAGSDPAEGMPEALVFAGTSRPFHVPKYSFQASSDCCVFLRITFKHEPSEVSPGTVMTTVETDSGFPVPDVTQYIVPIAQIVFNGNGHYRIFQMQFGNVYIAGRVI